MTNEARDIIELQLSAMNVRLQELLEKVARRCSPAWHKPDLINAVLGAWIKRMPYCRLLYVVDKSGVQISANMHANHEDHQTLGQDLSDRPYFRRDTEVPFSMSEVYISRVSRRSCITAVHAVTREGEVMGYVAADFDLRELPLMQANSRHFNDSQRIAGDPTSGAGRSGRRTRSMVDEHIEDVNAILDELICEHGVFHAKLHYSSSRVTLWLMDDPYHYRIHVLDELVSPALCLAYRRRIYPTSAVVVPEDVIRVFRRCAELRMNDDDHYLRAGSLNIMNGLVALTFSSDDTLYLPVAEFLDDGADVAAGDGAEKPPGETVYA